MSKNSRTKPLSIRNTPYDPKNSPAKATNLLIPNAVPENIVPAPLYE